MADQPQPEDPSSEILPREELEKLSPQARERLEFFFEVVKSPLLPPKLLREYDQAVPGLAVKLVSWTESETDHRRTMDRLAFDESNRIRSRGQTFGFVVALTGVAAAAVLGAFSAAYGSAAGATAAVFLAVVSVGGPFVARELASRMRFGGKGE